MCDYLMWEERCKLETWYFRVLKGCKTDKFDMRRIYPLKQREVLAVSQLVETMPEVAGVWVIGSAASIKCTGESDLDLVIELESGTPETRKNDVSLQIQELTEWDCDILWRDRISERDIIYGELTRGIRIK